MRIEDNYTKDEKGKWKITKFWSDKDWKYEIAYWVDDYVCDEEYFDDKEEAELYLEECIKEEK
tara:strand:+ start:1559 stop:1747 length:189 start_codon:yes stop_codon:yes gene_type:complete